MTKLKKLCFWKETLARLINPSGRVYKIFKWQRKKELWLVMSCQNACLSLCKQDKYFKLVANCICQQIYSKHSVAKYSIFHKLLLMQQLNIFLYLLLEFFFRMQGWKMHCNLQESRKILHFLQLSISAILVPTLAPEKELWWVKKWQ